MVAVPVWLSNTSSHRVLRDHTKPPGLLLNWMPQLKMYERYAYQHLHQYLRHIFKEQELNQDFKKILRGCNLLKAIPARWLLIQFLRTIPKIFLILQNDHTIFCEGEWEHLAFGQNFASGTASGHNMASGPAYGQTLPLARPLAKTWPLARPLATTLPLAWPLAKTWPSA